MSEGMPPPPSRPASPWAGRAVLGFVLVLLGVGWLLETLDVDVPWDLVLPVALIGIGGVLVVSARSNAAQGGLIAAGVVLTVLLLIGTAIDVPLGGGVGDRTVRPTGRRIEPEVERAIGTLTLDLTAVEFDAIGAPLDVRAHVGIGQLIILVPRGAPVQVDAHAGLGSVRVDGRQAGGFGAELSSPASGATLVLVDASVGIGEVRVEHD